MARDMISAPADELAIEQSINRKLWIAALRSQGHRKCVGDLFIGNEVCALGLLAEVAGFSGADCYYDIGAAAGLNAEQVGAVWRLNDGHQPANGPPLPQHSFAEIADVIEGWFRA